MNKETLEEAAEKYARKQCDDMYDNIGLTGASWGWETALDFIAGAKWQAERMYSEEEQLNLLNEYNKYLFTFIDKEVVGIGVEKEDVRNWFEQFKKK